MPMPNCDICNKEAVGVACSPLGAFSQAYCMECLKNCAEPKGMVDIIIECVGGYNNLANWIKDTVFVLHNGEYISIRKWKEDKNE